MSIANRSWIGSLFAGMAALALTCSSYGAGGRDTPYPVYTGFIGGTPEATVPGRLIVKFRDDTSDDEAGRIAGGMGGRVERAGYRRAFHVLRVPAGNMAGAMKQLQKEPRVEYVHPDCVAFASMVPNDPMYAAYQWNFDNAKYGGIRASKAWDLCAGGSASVIVAVLDTGIAYENYGVYVKAPDLAGTSFVAGYDFVNNDAHANDDNGHGTHVSGTIAQTTNNGVGVAGIAFRTTLMPVKVLGADGSGTISGIADGIRYAADHGAKVINMSLGTSARLSYLTVLTAAIEYAAAKGVVMVAAAGNAATGTLEYPAAYPQVMAVTATTYNNTLAYYANTGAGLSLAAPGGTDRADLNGDGNPDMILQMTFSPVTRNPADFGYWLFCGTSMATPHVAGAAALLFAAGAPDAATVRSLLESSATDLGTPGYDTTYGYGLVNPAAALQMLLTNDMPPTVTITSPTSGATVAGQVVLQAAATDDHGAVSVRFTANGATIGTDTYGADGWSATWNTTTLPNGAYILAAVATDTIGQTTTSAVTVHVANTTTLVATSTHVGDLDSLVATLWFGWQARVVITVHDNYHRPLANAYVSGTWSGGYSRMVTALTNSNGQATVTTGTMSQRYTSTTFTVTNLTAAGLVYTPASNHDPDGGSTGTVIVVKRP